MYRIGGRLRSKVVRSCGAAVGIPLFCYWFSNNVQLPWRWTVIGGQFDWGGRLPKSNGGAQRFPQNGWKPFEERNGRREPDCETHESGRDESRA